MQSASAIHSKHYIRHNAVCLMYYKQKMNNVIPNYKCCYHLLLKWVWKLLGLLVIILVIMDVLLLTTRKPTQIKLTTVLTEEKIKNAVHITSATGHTMTDQVCVHPALNPFGKHVTKYLHKENPVVCPDSPDWIIIQDGRIMLRTPKAETQKHGIILCSVSFIKRNGDNNISFKQSVYFQFSRTIKVTDDFFKLKCSLSSGKLVHVRFHSTIAVKPELFHRKPNAPPLGLGLNVLIVGFDSVSHMNFLRNFPKTYEYFTKSMDGNVLNGYNIVGDATFKALCPLLTGKTDKELPPTMEISANRKPMDIYPFIWKDYMRKGYVTAYAEDMPGIGTFQYRRSGFIKQPTDHYMRPYYLTERTSSHIPKDEQFCRGNKHRYRVFSDWIKDFFSSYSSKPKFAFAFHSEQSHSDNINLAGTLDDDVLIGLRSLVTGGHLSNTMLILMSDHGSRFTGLRATLQGKQEERLPFMGFVLPRWFKDKYPKAMTNLHTNIDRLVTPFDIHTTFSEILHYSGDGVGNTSQRGISLFKEIPKSRSCHEAGIAPHWCACLAWETLILYDFVAVSAVDHLIRHNNQITKPLRNKCHELKLKNITQILHLIPTYGILKYKRALDADKLIGDFTDTMSVDVSQYQVSVITRPGNAVYEATLTHQKSLNRFSTNTEEISRLDKYGNSSACVVHDKEDLRKFCLCK